MADVKTQLEDLKKHDATAAQRKKLDKAIRLLPKLDGNPKAQDDFVALVLSLLDDSPADKTEGLPQIRTHSGSELLARLGAGGPEGTRGIGDWFGGIAGSVGQFLNLTNVVRHERSVGRSSEASGVAQPSERCTSSCPGSSNPSGRPQPRWPADGELRESAQRDADASGRLADAARGGVLAFRLQRRQRPRRVRDSSATWS